MARCNICNSRLGLLHPKIVVNRVRLCKYCRPLYAKERSQQELQEFLNEGNPKLHFVIPMVKSLEPDFPNSPVRLIGDMAFTDRGILYLGFGEYKEDTDATTAGFLIGGIIGAAIAEAFRDKKKHMTETYTSAQQLILNDQPAFHTVLQRVERIIFMPARGLRSLKHSQRLITVKSYDHKRPLRFMAVDKLREFKPQLQEYRRLIDLGDVSLYQQPPVLA